MLGYNGVDDVSVSSNNGINWLSYVDCNDEYFSCLKYCTNGGCPTTQVPTCFNGPANITCYSNGNANGYGGNQYRSCDYAVTVNAILIVVGILLAVIVIIAIVIAAAIGIPLCICFCIGVDISDLTKGRRSYDAL
jgi:hypothetical protein